MQRREKDGWDEDSDHGDREGDNLGYVLKVVLMALADKLDIKMKGKSTIKT